MWVSLDPVSGRVDVYPPEVQELLRGRQPGNQVFLGSLCFQATVHVRTDGRHFQTTPGVAAIPGCRGKMPGHRQVRRTADRVTRQVLYKKHWDGTWMFCDAGDDGAEEVVLPPMPQNLVPVWQWCNQEEPSRDHDHWWCFPSEVEDLLRQAWDQNDVPFDQASHWEFEIQFMFGVKKVIHVNRTHMFHKMIELGKTRWVRRIFMEADVAQKLRETVVLASPPDALNDSCPICLEDFTEGNDNVTLHCQHAFHLKCLEPMEKSECPMCRKPF